MNAWILHGIHDLRYETTTEPTLKEGWCLVKVKAAGICGSDIPRIFETGAHRHPLIPGHEFSGVVVKGSEKWQGKRVGIFPLIPCMECEPCKHEKYEMCRNYNYLGSRCDGGFAEYAAVPEKNLIALPENVSQEQAAMLEPSSVAMHAIRQIHPKAGEKAVVIGLGTIGLLLCMLLKELNVDIYAIGNKPYQYEMLKKLGIERKETGKGSADCVFECVGRPSTISDAIEYAAPSARVVTVGNPASDISLPKDVYWKILRNQLELHGTWNSSFTGKDSDDWHQVLRLLAAERIHPELLISHILPLERLEEGLSIMHEKKEPYTKIMCVKQK